MSTIEPQVLNADGVAALFGWKCRSTFDGRRLSLEANGFPRKLPGVNAWSRPAIMRWLEANGAAPATPEAANDAPRRSRLEARFA